MCSIHHILKVIQLEPNKSLKHKKQVKVHYSDLSAIQTFAFQIPTVVKNLTQKS